MAEQDPLASILTPELLDAVVQHHIPWLKQPKVGFTDAAAWYFRGRYDGQGFHRICYSALKRISEIGLENIPDLIRYLPPPEDVAFPARALGLQILIDQGPRMLFHGVDGRWTNGYFDIFSEKLARRLLGLANLLRPDALQRWLDAGYTFEHWVVSRFWFIAPIAHSEDLQNHKRMLELVDELRIAVERHSATSDPYRASRDRETLVDVTMFSRRGIEGPPKEDSLSMQDFAYWFMMLIDCHYPIIRTYGRYPYRNGILGRVSTEQEEQFLVDTNGFGCVDPETEEKIRQDVLAGRWTPLGAGEQQGIAGLVRDLKSLTSAIPPLVGASPPKP
ncbi:hypothetical protein AURDEDRAFT_67328 [Auricularia subglabra TFB-10046 SS5]|nr:hypothetical protein AURDEDRAFT_67328 [Auricularia subglabra TFB-10046 SS5]